MTDGVRMSTISSTERRNDLHLTTTGVGYAYKPAPPEKFKEKPLKPLPRKLTFPCQLTINDVYGTTYADTYDYKQCPQTALHKKAPAFTKVHYNLDTNIKLDKKPCRLPLSMGNQTSESHAKYSNKTIQPISTDDNSLVHQTLVDHFNNGVTKNLKPTDPATELQGKNFRPQDQAILQRCEPYMTTNNWYHRRFTLEELNKYPKKDIATYWQCEDYPKGWGFGTKINPLTKRNNKTDPGPMRDRMVFKTSTTIPLRLPKKHVPLSGWLRPVYSTMYTRPPYNELEDHFASTIKSKYNIQTSKDTSLLRTVPKMYETNNMIYGESI